MLEVCMLGVSVASFLKWDLFIFCIITWLVSFNMAHKESNMNVRIA
jgi:hypothetical protein